ncbi:transcriptional regulator [Candidatus Fermentibacteria bacterium]|nr:MAG: transcriptional regulator [Candidatus Fermentibacteria bacterium]
MRKDIRLFISSVQSEFSKERIALRDFIQGNALLGKFFTVFIFEDTPAEDRKPDSVYLDEIGRSDIYLGLFGEKYGRKNSDGLSATHAEFNEATRLGVERLVFRKRVDEAICDRELLHFLSGTSSDLTYHPFTDLPQLLEAVYSALIRYLETRKLIVTGPFDASSTQKATLDDISDAKISEFLVRARNTRGFPLDETTPKLDLLKHLDLLDEETPKNAALLLFGEKPQKFFITSEVKCMMFYGNTVTKPIPSYQIYKGTVFEMVDQAVDFIMSRVDCYVGEAIKSNQVPVEYEIPQQVVREAIVNAVAHRDYTSNGSVQVMLFRDRFEIWNPGRLPSALSISMLYEPHTSIPANPLIAEEMYRAGYIEKAGSGTIDMLNRCREAEIPEPVFSTETGQFTISFRRKSSLTDQVTPHVTPQVPRMIKPHDKMRLDSPQNRLIAVLVGEMSRIELMDLLELRDRKSFMDNYIDPAIQSGAVRMTLPDNPRSKSQKYCLTAIGEKRKKELTVQVTVQVTDQVTDQVADHLMELLTVVIEEMSSAEIMSKLGLSHKPSFRTNYINQAIAQGLLEMTIPNKPTSSKQKYRLTAKGKQLQKEIE